ncbi:hypothetical protein PENSPDRAFT_648797 [Peniophora sp. CONT]|nr:hypothetical protein PENSPDRAFT_648797 [Peniophora sp. CONT]
MVIICYDFTASPRSDSSPRTAPDNDTPSSADKAFRNTNGTTLYTARTGPTGDAHCPLRELAACTTI